LVEEPNFVPQRGHIAVLSERSEVPQLPQKADPAGTGAPQLGQLEPADCTESGVPQLMQRFAESKLSVPHLGQGL